MFTWPSWETQGAYQTLFDTPTDEILPAILAMDLGKVRAALNDACIGQPLELCDAQAARFVIEALIYAKQQGAR